MTLFTLGPVQMHEETLEILGTQQPFYKTEFFAEINKGIEKRFLESLNADDSYCSVLFTSSGSGAMEASVVNAMNKNDRALVINTGAIGERYKRILDIYRFEYDEAIISGFDNFDRDSFDRNYSGKGFTHLFLPATEPSTGRKLDLDFFAEFARKNNMYYIVSAPSAYLADKIDVTKSRIDILFTVSEGALAVSPGLVLMAISGRIYEEKIKWISNSFYFNLNAAITNQKKGWTVFTPDVGNVMALSKRFERLSERGFDNVCDFHAERVGFFRKGLQSLSDRVVVTPVPMSNAITSLIFRKPCAAEIYEVLKNKFNIYVMTVRNEFKDMMLTVGNLGNVSSKDYENLLDCLDLATGDIFPKYS